MISAQQSGGEPLKDDPIPGESCPKCSKQLGRFDIRMNEILKTRCLDCGHADGWADMSDEEAGRCRSLYKYLNMDENQRKTYDRNMGS